MWCEVTYADVRDAAGKYDYSVAIISDISERKAAEERQAHLAAQLQQAQKMETIGQLTGGIAHDFNNLLSIVLGNLEFLEETCPSDSEQATFISNAIKAALRGAELIRRLLAFARRQSLAPKLTELAPVLEGSGQLFRRTLGENITLEVKADDNLFPVMIDVAQLESALLNLAVNARDAMPNGGSLVIEAHNIVIDDKAAEINPEAATGEYVAISVSDTGDGMPPEVAAKAFDPFFTTKGAKGNGLGLSMVHGFVKQSGGYTRIYSEPARGTTVHIYLPHASKKGPEESDTVVRHGIATGNEVILVVEDNLDLREVATRRLQELGYKTIPAADAAEGLEIIRGGVPIDLLFTDVVMPGAMDGKALVDAARRLRPRLKVLFTSGFTAAAASAAMNASIGGDLLTKPYRKDELARRVRAALDDVQ